MEPTADAHNAAKRPQRGPDAWQRKRDEVLIFVRDFMRTHNRPPTQREAAAGVHQDTRNLAKHWDALTRDGLLPERLTRAERLALQAAERERRAALRAARAQQTGSEELPSGPAGQILDDVAAQLRGFINRMRSATAKEKESGTRYWQQRLAEIGQLTEEAFTLVSGQEVDDFIRHIQRQR